MTEKLSKLAQKVGPADFHGLRKMNALRSMNTLLNDVSDAFEDFGHMFGFSPLPDLQIAEIIPPMDIVEYEDRWEVRVEVPCVDRRTINVEVIDDILKVAGTKSHEHSEEDEECLIRVSERFFGKFYRELTLPANVKVDGISASYKKGLITVTVPKEKPDEKKKKTIQVEVKDEEVDV